MKDVEVQQIVCGGDHSLILKKNGELLGFGYNEYGQLGVYPLEYQLMPVLIMKDTETRQIACGGIIL